MKKNKEIGPAFMFKDQIWKIYDDDSEEMIWENSLHRDMFGNDDEPDSEYKKQNAEKQAIEAQIAELQAKLKKM